MKVYKSNPLDIDLGPLSGVAKPALVILVLAILALILTTQTFNALHAELKQNPLSLSANDSTMLEVLVTNPMNTSVSNVVVSLAAPGSEQLSLYPEKLTIQTLGPQETRKLEFLISPVDATSVPFYPGTYRVDVSAKIGEKTYQTSVFVRVEK